RIFSSTDMRSPSPLPWLAMYTPTPAAPMNCRCARNRSTSSAPSSPNGVMLIAYAVIVTAPPLPAPLRSAPATRGRRDVGEPATARQVQRGDGVGRHRSGLRVLGAGVPQPRDDTRQPRQGRHRRARPRTGVVAAGEVGLPRH